MHLFYTPDIDAASPVYYLDEEESKHCIKVLRLHVGDHVQLIDGKGNFYDAAIAVVHPKRTQLSIISTEKDPNRREHYLHIAVAPTKNIERLEWFLEKATEIGIDEISLIICQRSERKDARVDRLREIITSAIKQSLKAWHPVLNEPVPLSRLLSAPFKGQKFIAHCEPGDKLSLKEQLDPSGRYLILIGPEGDFTHVEIEDALKNDFKAITLGKSRLRTETAALEACFEVNFINRV